MTNLTIVVEDEIFLRAPKRTLDHGTSVKTLPRSCHEICVGQQNWIGAMKKFMQSETSAKLRSSKAWTRDELHER
jgi:hypothetical protein